MSQPQSEPVTEWYIHETPMWPCKFKISKSREPLEGDNFPTNFFRTREEAMAEINRRKALE